MYSPPTIPTAKWYLPNVFDLLAGRLDLTSDGSRIWGSRGQALSGPVLHPRRGQCWFRVVAAQEAQVAGELWNGNRAAAALFEGQVQKAELYETIEDAYGGVVFLGELFHRVTERVCSTEPVLSENLDLPAAWWESLRTDLTTVAKIPTDRVTIRQEWVNFCVPQLLWVAAPWVTDWSTAHGDLTPANLTRSTPFLLGWESFGMAPVGYDAAMLLACSGLFPEFAQRVRAEFPVLSSEAGKTAILVAAAELLQPNVREDQPELVPSLRALVSELV